MLSSRVRLVHHIRPVTQAFLSFKRGLSAFSASPLRISREIQDALQSKKPVVALESTIITHGLPFPQNVAMAQKVEQVIRSEGAVPATVAFIQGQPCVGLTGAEVEYLAEKAASANKISRRDIAYTMAHKLNGGTTISGTMILAEKAGIKVFATGGLGGAHKGSEHTFDISADLTELGKTKVAVVCAGPKSILDVSKTIEFLETQGCFVSTYGKQGTNIPGFFAVDSGVTSPYNFDSYKDAASILHHGMDVMGLNSGYLFCIPPPADAALDSAYISSIIREAEIEADNLGIGGKSLTPFLLSKIAAITKGSSVDTNLKVVFNNAIAASKIAIELSKLETNNRNEELEAKPTFQPLTKIDKRQFASTCTSPSHGSSDIHNNNATFVRPTKVDITVIGSVAVDLICKLSPDKFHIGDSNPGKSSTSIGGVAYNVSLASKYAATAAASPTQKQSIATIRLISQVGKDDFGKLILTELRDNHIDSSGIIVNEMQSTAKYVSVHDKAGSLIVACADMEIAENFDNKALLQVLKDSSPEIILADGNMSVKTYDTIIKQALTLGSKVIFEPTSSVKAGKIAQVIKKSPLAFIFSSSHLSSLVTENNYENVSGLVLATPTVNELRTIHDQLDQDELFDVSSWFPVLDAAGINSDFRNKLDGIIKDPVVGDLVSKGVFQQAFKVLPYIPCLIVKLGKDGILVFNLTVDAHKHTDSLSQFHKNEQNVLEETDLDDILHKKPVFTITSKGRVLNNSEAEHQLGVIVQYYKVPQPVKESSIKNVTGAGDSFVGCLTQQLGQDGVSWLFEPSEARDKALNRAQFAAGLSLQCEEAISKDIEKI